MKDVNGDCIFTGHFLVGQDKKMRDVLNVFPNKGSLLMDGLGDTKWHKPIEMQRMKITGFDSSDLPQRGWAQFIDDCSHSGFESYGVFPYYGSVTNKVLVKDNDGEFVLMAQHLFSVFPALKRDNPPMQIQKYGFNYLRNGRTKHV